MLNILKKRQFKLLLACISLLLLLDLIQDTYAKYISGAEATVDFAIARWAFLVNSQDVLDESNFSNTIVPTFDTNANIATGVIAPTSTGYFDIEIDSSDVDVAYSSTISLSQNSTNTVDDLVFVGYSLNDGTMVSLNDVTTATITTNHPLNEINTVNTYRVYIKWNDDALTETMDNADDTAASQSGDASVVVNLNFIQLAANTGSNQNPDPNPEPDPDPTPEP